MPENMMSDADYVFPASCAANGDTVIPIRKAGKDKTFWFAPDGTTSFKAGSNMTKSQVLLRKSKRLRNPANTTFL